MAFWKKIWDFFTFEDEEDDDFLDGGISGKAIKSVSGSFDVFIMEISSYDEVNAVTEKLRAGNGVVVDLKAVPYDEKKRTIDFICGAIYALNGKIQRLQDDYFFFAPQFINFVVENNESELEENELVNQE